MKKFKKLLAVMLAAIMVMSMSTSVFADLTQASSGQNSSGTTLTITEVTTGNHVFTAYQIFSGTLSNSGTESNPVYVLSDIDWGDCIDDTTFLTALKNSEIDADTGKTLKDYFSTCTSAEDVAKVLTNNRDNEDLLSAFTTLLTTTDSGSYLYLKYYSNTSTTTSTGSQYTYTISNLDVGYYLVTDSLSTSGTDDETVSDYFLQVLGSTSVTYKPKTPTVNKVITDSNNVASSDSKNTASVGDTVTFTITVNVPSDITGYGNGYTLTIKDTLPDGLTFASISSIKVTSGGTDYDIYNSTNGITITTGSVILTTDTATSTGGGYFTLEFANLLTTIYTGTTYFTGGETITIVYTATLNSSAVIGTTGNTNTVNLTYSNDPNSSGTGFATPATTTTYTTQLTIEKVDASSTSTTLKGAEFTIYEKTSDTYEVDGTSNKTYSDSSTYFIFVNGVMYDLTETTTISGLGLTTGDTYNVYKKITSADTTSDSNEYENAVLKDLGAGDYILIETQTPSGYNTMVPLEVTITYTETNGFAMTYTEYGGSGSTSATVTDGKLSMTIKNSSGYKIATTGGMGTTILYIIGAILVISAAVILVTRRRMANK